MADLSVAESVLTWAEDHPMLSGLDVGMEDFAGVPSVMVQTLVGEPYITRYKSGGYLAAHPFALYLRIDGTDSKSRLDALRLLGDIGRSIDDEATWPAAPDGYNFIGLELRTTPARVAVSDDGIEDYQATFELKYRKKG